VAESLYLRDPVTVVEVGPRDGLQNEPDFFPTEAKIELINRLSRTGLKRLEITSFVHPKIIPQFSDVMEVINGIERSGEICYSALVPNAKGCERALKTPIDELALFVSASETHNRKNVNMSVDESLATLKEVAKMGLGAGKRLRGYVITSFGCPYEGRVPVEKVVQIVRSYVDMGVAEVSLGDTTGMANPRQVADVFRTVMEAAGPVRVAAHFHNSRGTGLANALAAYQAGVRVFDSSVGGIGGCPTALGAMGNIDTGDFISMMEEMGVSTGVDFEKLTDAARFAAGVIGSDLPSCTLKAGRPKW
jgi:hydroxymethylglutaryl-CoA lyase